MGIPYMDVKSIFSTIDKVIEGQNKKDSDDIVPNMKKRYFSKVSLKASVNSLNCFTAQYD